MKKFTLLITMLLAVVGVKADVEWTIWEGTATATNVYMAPVDFTNVEAGDIMCVYVSSALAHRGLAAQLGSGWTWTNESSLMEAVDDEDGNYHYVINSGFVTLLASSDTKSFIVSNYDSGTITKITIKKKNSMIKTVLSSDSKTLGNWAQSYTVNSGYTNAVEGDYLLLAASRQALPVNDRYDLTKATEYTDNAAKSENTITFSADNGKYGWNINGNWLNKYSHGATVTVKFGDALTTALSLVVEYKYMDGSEEKTTTNSSSAAASATSVSVEIPNTSTYVTNIYLQGSNGQTVTFSEAYVDYENDEPYCQTQISYGDGWTYLYAVNSFSHDNWKKLTSTEASTIASAASVHLGGTFYSTTGLYLYHPVTSFSIGSIGMATFCANVAVNVPTGIEAYYATVNGEKTGLILHKITDSKIPANTGVIIMGDAGSVVEFTETTTETTYDSNVLQGVTTATTMAEGNYILYNNSGTAEFRKVTATDLAANKAYLPAATLSASPARLSIVFDDSETTAISEMKVQQPMLNDGAYYNLAGQRVDKPTKGLYIVNGKKVVIK